MVDRIVLGYIYRYRALLFFPLAYIAWRWIVTETDEMVPLLRSGIFLYTFFTLAFLVSLSTYMYANVRPRLTLSLSNLLVPVPFVYACIEHYSGSSDTLWEIAFYLTSILIVIQTTIWMVSLFLKPMDIKEIENTKSVIATIKKGEHIVDTLKIENIDECLYSVEMYSETKLIDFSSQYTQLTQTLTPSTQEYHLTSSYFKFGECHQERELYTVTLSFENSG